MTCTLMFNSHHDHWLHIPSEQVLGNILYVHYFINFLGLLLSLPIIKIKPKAGPKNEDNITKTEYWNC